MNKSLTEFLLLQACKIISKKLDKKSLDANIKKSFVNFSLLMLLFYSSLVALFVIHFLLQLLKPITIYNDFPVLHKMTSCDVIMPSSDFMSPGCEGCHQLSL